ncbi:SRPBCC family protein [Rhodococcus sp. D2-41]|uniref:SRPBCC family protein n=1 Tax=Speluncibacter jeojiensis TaxID=2710754 RepID=A0A9X4RCR0_9ACTN|nr:SRPBCC family protein [Rhodococcus sp. D2-41]MDG3010383.1 SRPBCC family protein [Rhodococcus sp. D2-41]MDG3014120.1 SRPBCC family protein [Corynebacteriales bacterium D3-21]
MTVTGGREVDIAATPAQVMAVLADVESMPSWSPVHRDVTVESWHPDGRPQRVRQSVLVMGVSDEHVVEYEWDGDERVSWKLVESARLSSQDGEYRLTATPKGTHVAFTLAVDIRASVPGFLVKRAQKSILEAATDGLRKRVG